MPITPSKTARISLIISLIVSSTISLIAHNNLFQRLENFNYDFVTKLVRKGTELPQDISIILIDDPALQLLNPVVGRWPWPRSIYQEIINYISMGKPKAILFDILFSEQQKQTDNEQYTDDMQLIIASENANNVFHAMQFLVSDEADNIKAASQSLPNNIVLNHSIDKAKFGDIGNQLSVPSQSTPYNEYLIPFSGLHEVSKNLGVVNAVTDKDGIYRRAQLYFPYQEKLYPALSIAAINQDSKEFRPIAHNLKQLARTTSPNSPLYTPVNFYAEYHPISMSGVLQSISKMQSGDIENILISPQDFDNKYVFIGASAIGLHDLKPTPLHNLVPGTFIHASILGNVLSNELLHYSPRSLLYMTIVLLALLTTHGVLSSKKLTYQVLLPSLIGLLYFFIGVTAMRLNVIIPMIAPIITIVVAWILTFIFLLSTEEKEKKKIRQMFSRYISPAALSIMVDQYEDYKTAALGSTEHISILFADIRGFTALSETLAADEIVKILNYYFSAMTKVIFDHNGTVDKFIGDAIMATWGAPIKSESHALDSVTAAMKMYRTLETVNVWLRSQSFTEIDIGIGIHTGNAILGSIGSEQKADYTVIGDSVNLSSRLEGITKLYQRPLIISETTYLALNQAIPCQVLDCVQVKGKHEAIKIFSPIFYGKGLSVQNESQAKLLEKQSQQVLTLFEQRSWLEAKTILKNLPIGCRNPQLLDRCEQYLRSDPPAEWQATAVLNSK